MLIKCDMLMNASTNKTNSTQAQVRTGGWSEGWYADGSPDGVKANFEIVCQARAALLPGNASIVGQRYRIVNGGSSTGGRVFPGGANLLGDIPQVALLCTVSGQGQPNIRRFRIGGLPDARVVEGEYSPATAYDGALQRYFKQCATYAMRFKCRNLSATRWSVVSINAQGAVVTANGTGVSGVQFIDLLKCRDANDNAVKGRYKVMAGLDNNHFTILGWNGAVVVKGEIRPVDDQYPIVDANTFHPNRVVVHKVGRAFFQYRGRASKRS